MYSFNYSKPSSLSEALETLTGSSDGQLLAGGQTILPTMKQRLASAADLIDLSGLGELKGIESDGTTITIGAMTRHSEVASSWVVQDSIPALAQLAESIGDPQVRNQGTLGGSIANNDPAADYPAALVGLGATVKTSKREISADDFFTGMFETALDDDEIIVSVSFLKAARAAYSKFPNPASRYAIVGVFVSQGDDGVRVAVTGAAPSVYRDAAMESALADNFSAASLDGSSTSSDGMNSDIHASAEYRAHLVGVMAKRAVAAIE